jgi:hypothetical protein
MGGHYGTDLFVGGLLWAISVWFAALATTRLRPACAPPQDVHAFSGLDVQPVRGEAAGQSGEERRDKEVKC